MKVPKAPLLHSPWCQFLHAADSQAVTVVYLCVWNSGERRGQGQSSTEGACASPQDGATREAIHWSGRELDYMTSGAYGNAINFHDDA